MMLPALIASTASGCASKETNVGSLPGRLQRLDRAERLAVAGREHRVELRVGGQHVLHHLAALLAVAVGVDLGDDLERPSPEPVLEALHARAGNRVRRPRRRRARRRRRRAARRAATRRRRGRRPRCRCRCTWRTCPRARPPGASKRTSGIPASITRLSTGISGLLSEPLTAIASTSFAIASSISPITSSDEVRWRPALTLRSTPGAVSASASTPSFCAT